MRSPDQGVPNRRRTPMGPRLLVWGLGAVIALVVLDWLVGAVLGLVKVGLVLAALVGLLLLVLYVTAPSESDVD